ncbi:MAG TPA: transcription termination/antitermination protein NusA [Clostridiales bacterium]|jgi:N utilization substance protein A|nr:transcription termination/antitermination protein NusA [Clostridiales bacterium]
MNEELYQALEDLEKEKGIPKDFMLERIKQALVAAFHRDNPGAGDNIEFIVDPDTKQMHMYVLKTVTEEVLNPATEISLEEARRVRKLPRPEIGDVIRTEVKTKELGRIAAQTAKQVIIQGIRESERGAIYQEFSSKEHEILTAIVTRVDQRTGNVILTLAGKDDEKTLLLPPSEQIPNERLREGDYVKVYLLGVNKALKGPQLQISRTHPGLVRRLFEMEVPEIFDGTVELVSIAREPGSRTKIAVRSDDPNVDSIGACVGPRGARVNAIVSELRGEKIDIVNYSDDPAEYVAAALAPAEVIEVTLLPEGKSCRVIVPDDQLSLAIGKEGQNARLAAKLTGYKIDIKPLSVYKTEE